LDIRQLRYFAAICETGSFSQAARSCFISHQGISLAMLRLEDEIGGKLFRRTMKGIELTDEARFLLPRAKQILALISECEDELIRSRQGELPLSLWCGLGVLQEFADPILADFRENHAEIRLKITEDTDVSCDYAVDSEEAEIGITMGSVDAGKFDAELIFSTPDYVHAAIVHVSHPLAQKDVLHIEDLKDVHLAMLNENTKSHSQLGEMSRKAGFELIVDAPLSDILSAFYYAQSGRLVGISTTGLARRLRRENIVAVPFDEPEAAWQGYLIKKKGASLTKQARAFENTVLRHRRVEGWRKPEKVMPPQPGSGTQ
jgi:DNA-binding transcriptional LysR family regulator